MKKIINSPANAVDEMCRGLALAHGHLELLPRHRIIKKRRVDGNKVSLITGGGSGHEPAHAGFIGEGMLDAVVCGDVFASPSQIQVYNAIRAVTGPKGSLLIIKNYSGDNMNFRNAALLAEADGLVTDLVKVADDIAVNDSLYTVGRRGVAGTVFVHKIAGAAAAAGADLPEVKRLAQKAADNVRSLGLALTSCTVPAKGSPTIALSDAEMEYGVGIHGEPGIRREAIPTADELAVRMVDSLAADLRLGRGDEAALLVNGFGGTPLMELYILHAGVRRELDKRGIGIFRAFVGNYMTSLEMAGGSVSLLRLDGELKPLLAAPCRSPGFRVDADDAVPAYEEAEKKPAMASFSATADAGGGGNVVHGGTFNVGNIVYMVDVMAETILKNEVRFCELDSFAGDGDFGMSIAKGFRKLKEEWERIRRESAGDIGSFLGACALVLMEHCGGASGPVWGFAFKYAARFAAGKGELDVAGMAELLREAVAGIQFVGERAFGRGAAVGDKTLVDALSPCADSWRQAAGQGLDPLSALKLGADAAARGAKATESIVARLGRAGTVGERSLGHPDAGAFALGVIFTDIADAMRRD